MKGYITLFSVPAAVGILSILFSKGYLNLFSQTDPIITELGSLLSPEAKIILPTENATLFSGLAGRFIQVFEPDITAVVKVGTEADVPVIVSELQLFREDPSNIHHRSSMLKEKAVPFSRRTLVTVGQLH